MDRYETYALPLSGGLNTHMSKMQQGLRHPGSLRVATNIVPSTRGGYETLGGYTKYDSNLVPPYGSVYVKGAGQSGTTLNIDNLYVSPVAGDTFTIAGNATVYTIAAGGVTYDSTHKSAALTITPTLATTPADKAVVTFVTGSGLITGVREFNSAVIAARGGSLWKSTGSGWTKINIQNMGTVTINGAHSSSDTTIDIDYTADTYFQVGDSFHIAGLDTCYVVSSVAARTGSGPYNAVVTVTTGLSGSLSGSEVVTLTHSLRSTAGYLRTDDYNWDGTNKFIGVDGGAKPFIWDGTTYTIVNSGSSTASNVSVFNNHFFLSAGTTIVFSAPYEEQDFTTGSGGGEFVTGDISNGIIVFRENLIIFGEHTIQRIGGTSLADFELFHITRELGCIEPDTIQEVGGDIFFFSNDSVRTLGASERNNDFNLNPESYQIQKDLIDWKNTYGRICSCVVREKAQYRLLGYSSTVSSDDTEGFVAANVLTESGYKWGWGKSRGFQATSIFSHSEQNNEFIYFGNDTGYIYALESGTDRDGSNLVWEMSTPYLPLPDPKLRKTIYSLSVYMKSEGLIELNMRLDFNLGDTVRTIQPSTIAYSNSSGNIAYYGTAVYGTNYYSSTIDYDLQELVTGSGETVSVIISGTSLAAKYIFDTIILEYIMNGRR